MIHSTAIIDKSAQIDPSVEIGPYVCIGQDVKIGKNTTVGHNSHIEFTEIGENCKVSNHVAIGNEPQDLKYKGEKRGVIIGNNCIIREFSTIHRGSLKEKTKVGNNCFIMAYTHMGHDADLGDNIIIANGAQMGGHVTIEDNAVLGACAAFHQLCRVGKYAMVGAGSMVVQDVPPYVLVCGDRAKIYGLNTIGLRRNKIDPSAIKDIEKAFHILFSSGVLFTKAFKQLEELYQKEKMSPEVKHLIDFIHASKRGICHPVTKDVRFKDVEGHID